MITSNQIIKLSEDWVTSIKVGNWSCDIYVNPSSSDLKELFQSLKISHNDYKVRYIADAKKQKVYVWNGYLLDHFKACQALRLGDYYNYIALPTTQIGYAVLSSGKLSFYDSSPLDTMTDAVFMIRDLKYVRAELAFEKFKKYERFLLSFFKINWSFLDKYIPGTVYYIQQQREKYLQYKKDLGY